MTTEENKENNINNNNSTEEKNNEEQKQQQQQLTSLSRVFTRYATEQPDKPAITCVNDATLTWKELDKTSNRLARSLSSSKIQQGDLVIIALPNNVTFWQVTIAIWKLGATPQFVSHQLPTNELKDIIHLTNSKVIIGTSDINVGDDINVLGMNFIQNVINDTSISDDIILDDKVSPMWKGSTSGGSTGKPKIILSTIPGIYEYFLPFQWLRIPTKYSTCCVVGPLCHSGTFSLSFAALLFGNHLINFPVFEPNIVLNTITIYKPEYLYLVPTAMCRIWKLPDTIKVKADLSSIKTVLHTTSPCPPWLKEEWIKWVGEPDIICELYGGTEGQVLTWITGSEWLEHRGSVGRPVGGKIKIVDQEDDETTLPSNKTGEIYLLSDNGIKYKYIGGEAKRLGKTEWESIGDLGYMDEEGYLYLADRRKDQITLRDYAKVYPAQVEAALEQHPFVRSCVVVGVPDDDLGQRVHAIVDLLGSSNNNTTKMINEKQYHHHIIDDHRKDELRSYLLDYLAPYKCPSTWEFVNKPVRDDAGKVRRSKLAEERCTCRQ